MKKIKVLRIIARLNIGGPAVHAILLTKWLNSDKFDSLLVTGVIGQNEGDMMYLAETNNIKHIIIKELGREVSWRDDIAAFYKILRLIIREKPDIIHTHTAKAGTLGRIAGIIYNIFYPLFHPPLTKGGRGGVMLVHTFHGHIFHSYFSPFKTKLFVFIERILAKFTHKIIAISNKQMNELSEKLKISYSKKFELIPLGLDLSSFYDIERYRGLFKKEMGLDKDVKLVGIIGRLVPVKNHRMFLNTIKIFNEKGDKAKVKFLIIGDGELREDLEKYSIEAGIAGYVIFTGWRKDLERVYADLDIVALTSFNEGTPVSIIEAMASGKPVIAAEVGGVRDMFTSKCKMQNAKCKMQEEGILIDSNDSDSLVDGIKFLLSNPAMAEDMGKKGRVFVKERFDIERLARDMEGMYERLVVSH
ncbi:MAG: glycosyltransferase [Nitrospinae bacterium]|nr:glycosyltransferase [Nitrospinota bacterium]